jgi:hypothetical protein
LWRPNAAQIHHATERCSSNHFSVALPNKLSARASF